MTCGDSYVLEKPRFSVLPRFRGLYNERGREVFEKMYDLEKPVALSELSRELDGMLITNIWMADQVNFGTVNRVEDRRTGILRYELTPDMRSRMTYLRDHPESLPEF